jgi:hypothetical protein
MLWLFVAANHQVLFNRKSANIRILHRRIGLCMVSFFLLTWTLFLLANCAATCVKNVFIYNCSPTVGRHYFSLGATWILNKCRRFLEWTRIPVTSLRLYFEEFISNVCWLFPLCSFRNSTAFTPLALCVCVCVWNGEGEVHVRLLSWKAAAKEGEEGSEQFPALTEASLDNLSRFFFNDFVWNGGFFCMFVGVWHKWTQGIVHWRILWWSWKIQLCK